MSAKEYTHKKETLGAALRQQRETARDAYAARPKIAQVSDISGDLGMIENGEFRSGTGTPGIDFTGGRFGKDVETATGYHFGTWNNDVLQVGFNTSGQFTWGAGAGVADADGLVVDSTSSGVSGAKSFRWISSGTDEALILNAFTNPNVQAKLIANRNEDFANSRLEVGALGQTTESALTDYSTNSGVNIIKTSLGSSVEFFTLTENGTTDKIVFNEGGNDIDFRVESDTKTHALFVDAAFDLVKVDALFSLGTAENLTIAGAAITITKSFCTLNPNAGTTGAFNQINGGVGAGDIVVFQAGAGDTITMVDGTGNINCGSNRVLIGNNGDTVILVYNGTKWNLISNARN